MPSSKKRKAGEPHFKTQLHVWEFCVCVLLLAALVGMASSTASLWIYGLAGGGYIGFRLLFLIDYGLRRQSIARFLILLAMVVTLSFSLFSDVRSLFAFLALMLADYYYLYNRRPR